MEPPSSKPTQPPNESPGRRSKLAWRLLLISNLALGAYLFARASKKESKKESKKDTAKEGSKAAAKVPSASVEIPTTPAQEELAFSSRVTKSVKVREPILEDQQRELFKWILEEKRKVKPKDPEEKRRIDEEKAILKQFIRAKSVPSL